MDKERFLQTYIDIETKTFIKADKNKKLDNLFKDKEIYKIKLTSTDILEIIDCLTIKDIRIRQPLFKHLIYPILSDQVEQNNVNAIKGLLKLDQHLVSYQGYTKDNTYSSWTLLEKGLSISPDDRELLELSEKATRDYLNYTLHELPTGVLYGANGATFEECEELIQEVEKYEILCDKLQRNESELIQECKFYYPAYKTYLSVYKNYKNFDDYLDKECDRPK
ncbi:hypothetical protein L0U88_19565 [Flavihumibacter sp. RY-1]|uniref:Uncharacterized protein n=1 Tax=Flavihumibacter fluminis TaxID=2909236 RepID=A0ABS9BNX0_9BACT|nr:hypothetical protein [Flavihumibacter fluminis]MCF1716850.1 hypothetical protein [Flavihumibacter fluminis]